MGVSCGACVEVIENLQEYGLSFCHVVPEGSAFPNWAILPAPKYSGFRLNCAFNFDILAVIP